MSEQERPTTAKTWRVEQGVGLIIDERVFPWHVMADGPMVEQIEPGDYPMHILWLPLLIEGPLPEYGRPDGEPVPDPTDTATTAADESGRS